MSRLSAASNETDYSIEVDEDTVYSRREYSRSPIQVRSMRGIKSKLLSGFKSSIKLEKKQLEETTGGRATIMQRESPPRWGYGRRGLIKKPDSLHIFRNTDETRLNEFDLDSMRRGSRHSQSSAGFSKFSGPRPELGFFGRARQQRSRLAQRRRRRLGSGWKQKSLVDENFLEKWLNSSEDASSMFQAQQSSQGRVTNNSTLQNNHFENNKTRDNNRRDSEIVGGLLDGGESGKYVLKSFKKKKVKKRQKNEDGGFRREKKEETKRAVSHSSLDIDHGSKRPIQANQVNGGLWELSEEASDDSPSSLDRGFREGDESSENTNNQHRDKQLVGKAKKDLSNLLGKT